MTYIKSLSFKKIMQPTIILLWLAVTISAAFILQPTQSASAYGPQTKTACELIGGTWEAPNESNRGVGNCSGENPCIQDGGIFDSTTRSCTKGLKSFSNDTLENRIKAFNYYVALSSGQCNFGGTIGGEDIGSYDWTLHSNPHLASNTMGSLTCNQEASGAWLKTAIDMFNIPGSTPGEKLCSLGMTQTHITSESLRASCGRGAIVGSKNEFNWGNVDSKRSSVLSTIRKWYFNNQEPSFSDAMVYHVAFGDFFSASTCAAKPKTSGVNYANGDSAAKEFTIQVSNPDGTVTSEVFVVEGENKTHYSEIYGITAVGGSRYGVGNVPCAEYLGGVNMDGSLPTVGSILGNVKYANAYAQYRTVNTGDPSMRGGSNSMSTIDPDQGTSCAIDGIGWIVCPVINFMAKIADGAFGFLATNLLETKSAMLATDTPTYAVWSQVRNIANVLFVLAFLLIVFSQMTSIGITSYGIKRLLPRLVIAAILVNISYFVCQLAVDISNILGYSIKSVFESVIQTSSGLTPSQISANQGATGEGFAGIAGSVLAIAGGGVLIYLMLGTLAPVLIAAIVALVMILFILVTRQALIVMLVIVSPLAFVAYLLPNTEQWFKKWQKTFVAMLMLFPIIATVFGASSLASYVITQTFGSGVAGDTEDWFGQIIGAAIAILPLFIVPGMLKKSLDSVGGIGAKMNGLGGKVSGALSKKGAQGYENSRIGQFKKFRQGEGARKRAKIQSGTYEGAGGRLRPGNLMSSLNSKINQSPRSGKFGDRATAQGAALEDAEDAELVKNATSRLDYFKQPGGNPLSQAQMMQIATGQDVTNDGHALHSIDPATRLPRTNSIVSSAQSFDTHTRKAAIQKAAKIATIKDAERLNNASVGMTAGERTTLANSLAGSSAVAKAPWLAGKNLGDITQGTANTDASAARAINDGKVTAETLANSDASGIETLLRVAAPGTPERTLLRAAYAEYLSQPLLHGKVTPGSEHDTNLGLI